MSYIFISYSRKSRDFAENVKNRLERAGLETWMDGDIRAGKEWRLQIDEAIKNAFVMVVIMTPEAKASEYVTYEWSFAVGVGIRLIPVKQEQTVLHPRLEVFQFLDFTDNVRPWEQLIEEVREAEKMPLVTPASAGGSSTVTFIDQAMAALNGVNADMRKDALYTLAQANSFEAQEALIEALAHPVADVREVAATVLGERHCQDAVPRLIELLFDDHQDVRMAAIASLVDIRDARTLPAFLEILSSKETWETEKVSIVDALSFFGDTSVVPALLALYGRSRKEQVLTAIIHTLGNLGAVSAIPVLQAALYDPTSSICSSAAQVLLQLQVDEGLEALINTLLAMDRAQSEPIVKALSSSALDKMIARLEAIYQKHLPECIVLAEKENAAKIRRRVIWIFRVLGNRIAIPALIRSMDDDDSVVQQETVHAFKVIQDQRALPALMTILRWRFEYYDEKTLLYAIQALHQLGNASVIPQLKAVLTEMLEKHLEMALQVIAVFGKLGNHETIDYLKIVNTRIKQNGIYDIEKKRELGEAVDKAIQELRSRL
jgi:HEAT repeat protein